MVAKPSSRQVPVVIQSYFDLGPTRWASQWWSCSIPLFIWHSPAPRLEAPFETGLQPRPHTMTWSGCEGADKTALQTHPSNVYNRALPVNEREVATWTRTMQWRCFRSRWLSWGTAAQKLCKKPLRPSRIEHVQSSSLRCLGDAGPHYEVRKLEFRDGQRRSKARANLGQKLKQGQKPLPCLCAVVRGLAMSCH